MEHKHKPHPHNMSTDGLEQSTRPSDSGSSNNAGFVSPSGLGGMMSNLNGENIAPRGSSQAARTSLLPVAGFEGDDAKHSTAHQVGSIGAERVDLRDEAAVYWERLSAPGPEKYPWDVSENDAFFAPLRATSQSALERAVHQKAQKLDADKSEYLQKQKASEKAMWEENLDQLSATRAKRRTRHLFHTLRQGIRQAKVMETAQSFQNIQHEWRHQGGTWAGHGDLSDRKCVQLWEEDDYEKSRQAMERDINQRLLLLERHHLLDSLDHDRQGQHRREECEWLANHVCSRLCPPEAGVTGPGISGADVGWPDENEAEEQDRNPNRSGSLFAGRSSTWSREPSFAPSPQRAGSYVYHASGNSPLLQPYGSPGKAPALEGGGVCQACAVS